MSADDRPTAAEPAAHDDFGGLHRDLPHLLGRRRLLQVAGAAGLAGLLAACGASASSSGGTTSPTTGPDGSASAGSAASTSTVAAATTVATTVAGAEIPDETQGPFPADGSNGPNVLAEEGVVREDLRTSFGGSTGTAEGVPTTFRLTVVDAATGTPLPGAAVYAWHCTADGRYSVYQVTDQNYLRGVQITDDAGRVSFTSVFPGCYPGRWPHVHFEVYPSLTEATSGSGAVKVSQLALPQADAEVVYAEAGYGSSGSNLARLSLDTDNVFRDGWADQLATVAGSVADGYSASLLVRV